MEPCLPPYDCSSWRCSNPTTNITPQFDYMLFPGIPCPVQNASNPGSYLLTLCYSASGFAEPSSAEMVFKQLAAVGSSKITAMCGSTESGSRRRKGRQKARARSDRRFVLFLASLVVFLLNIVLFRVRKNIFSETDRVVATNNAAPDSLDIEPTPATFGPSETAILTGWAQKARVTMWPKPRGLGHLVYVISVAHECTSVDHPSNNYSYYADTGVDDHHIKAAQKREGGGQPPHGSFDIVIDNSFGSLEKLIAKVHGWSAMYFSYPEIAAHKDE
ncbi:hypothetical protein Tco_0024230 [Tanacetum coccineum]